VILYLGELTRQVPTIFYYLSLLNTAAMKRKHKLARQPFICFVVVPKTVPSENTTTW